MIKNPLTAICQPCLQSHFTWILRKECYDFVLRSFVHSGFNDDVNRALRRYLLSHKTASSCEVIER